MSKFDIVCVARSGRGAHGHITAVGVKSQRKGSPTITLAVKAVRQMIRWSDVEFYSTDDEGDRVRVWRYSCRDCGAKTIRTSPDDISDDNLSKKPVCA